MTTTFPRAGRRPGLGLALALILATAAGRPADARQDPAARADDPVAAIDAEFAAGLRDLERARLRKLAALADAQPKDQAEQTRLAYFRDALSAGLYTEAEAMAERVLKEGDLPPDLLYLAHVANVLAEVDRGAFDESLDSIKVALADRDRAAAAGDSALSASVRVAVAEVYYQKLVQAGRFDVARKAFALLRDGSVVEAVKAYAENRLARLEMVGKPAPKLAGPDVDGKPFTLADLKGKPVLVVFWASWNLPSAAEAELLGDLYDRYRDRGFTLVGVNLDALDGSVEDAGSILPDVRRFLIEHNVRWPNLVDIPGTHDYAATWGVREIPADFLIGRDGNVVAVDLTGAPLAKAVEAAVGGGR